MSKKSLLIVGDSFAVDRWHESAGSGWSSMLAQEFSVTNLAQAGVGEYKILLQMLSVDLADFDAVIISHTSPNRVYIPEHPVHKTGSHHKHSDLIYNDIDWHSRSQGDNKMLQAAKAYFEYIYDQEYQEYVYRLIQKDMVDITEPYNTLNILTLYDKNIDLFEHCMNFYRQFDISPGDVNHYAADTHAAIYQQIYQWVMEHA